MTIEELKEHCIRHIAGFERSKEILPVTPNDYRHYEEHKMVLKLIEAWKKVKEELKESSYERYFEFGEYIGEDAQKIRIIGFDTAMDIINKHLKEVEDGSHSM